MRVYKLPAGLIAVIYFAAALVACEGGNDTGGAAGVPAVSRGVMKKGSVSVNGVAFTVPSDSRILHDDSPGSESLLEDGMSVMVRGRVNDDGATGVAESIFAESELQGTIAAKGTDSITLLGQQVFTDSRTVYKNVPNFPALNAGQWVTVHGIRDPRGGLLATRIEVRALGIGPSFDRLKGAVEGPFTGGPPPALTFVLRGFTVVTDRGTLIQPDGATVNPGNPVEVHGFLSGTTFMAGRVDREDLEDSEFEPREGYKFELEGFVSGFTSLSAGFTVGGATVLLNGAARFEGGVAADLINNARVEAEGRMTGGALLADKIRFDDTVRVEANADSAGRADVLGKTVIVTGRAELVNLAGGEAGIAQGQGLRIRGFGNPDGSITATRVEGRDNPVEAGGTALQGVVESFSASGRTILVNGITINASGAAGEGENDQPITLDEFFSLLVADRTVVKVQGEFSPGPPATLTAGRVELE